MKDADSIDTLLVLYFQITGLARRYPGLMSLRNVDLSPASWMAVAWYLYFSISLTVRSFSKSN